MSALTLSNVRIQLRHGTAAAWATANPTLAEGEVGIELVTGKIKFGDGGTPWNTLAYANAGPADTDALPEGATNLYYTAARFNSAFAGKTTTDLSEGTNLYYTNARADARIAAATITESQVTGLVSDLAAKDAVLTFSSPLSRSVNTISIPVASSSQNGYLASADWTTFNNKVGTARSISTSSPLTGGGDLSADRTISFSNQNANLVLAGPTTGGAAGPTFRSLVAADIPSLSATYLPLAGGTMTGALLFTDNAVDVGDATHRARNVYAGTQFLAADGTTSNPGLSFASTTGRGFRLSGTSLFFVTGGSDRIGFSSGGSDFGTTALFWGSALGVQDLILGREGAAILQLGTDSATPIAQTLKGPDARAGTDSNTVGGDLTLAAGRSTGTGLGGSLYFATSPAGSTGTAANALVNRLCIKSTGIISVGTGFTSADPALKKSSTTLKCRLADDSADAPFTCGDFTIGGGTAVKKVLSATAVLDFGNTLAQTDSDLTVTVTGAALGDVVILGVPNGSTQTGSCFSAWVSATDTVTVRFSVYGLTAKDPASGTYRITVIQF